MSAANGGGLSADLLPGLSGPQSLAEAVSFPHVKAVGSREHLHRNVSTGSRFCIVRFGSNMFALEAKESWKPSRNPLQEWKTPRALVAPLLRAVTPPTRASEHSF